MDEHPVAPPTAAWPADALSSAAADRYGHPLEPTDPRQVGPYRLTRRLGAGGMGTVYLGFTRGMRPVAVKTIRGELAEDAGFRQRFAAEVAAAKRVNGLYTAVVVDADPRAHPPWLVVAFIPGPTLHEAVAGHGPLGTADARVLAAGVAEALQAIHAAGTVHRDLKPSNVLLSPDGPRVIDFGISRATDASRLTATGVLIGSPHFMAPEQVTGHDAGPAADMFALGALLYFATTGRSPFGEGPAHAVLYRVVHDTPALDGVPPTLRDLVRRCLDKDPGRRPTPAEVLAALDDPDEADDGESHPVTTEPAEPAPPEAIAEDQPPAPAPSHRRDVLQVLTGAAILLLVIAGAVVFPAYLRHRSAHNSCGAGSPPTAVAGTFDAVRWQGNISLSRTAAIDLDLAPPAEVSGDTGDVSLFADGIGASGDSSLVVEWPASPTPTRQQCQDWLASNPDCAGSGVRPATAVCVRTSDGRVAFLTLQDVTADNDGYETGTAVATVWGDQG